MMLSRIDPDTVLPSAWPASPNEMAPADPDAAITTHDPAEPARILAHVAVADRACRDAVLERAGDAFQAWSSRTTADRCEALQRWLQRIEAHAEPIAARMTDEQGKPSGESRGEIAKALREARQMLAFAARHGGTVLPAGRPGYTNRVLRRPHGVVLAITPWNFPVLTPMRKLVPALVTGNAVVLKPSEFTPSAALALAELSEALLPSGCLSLLFGGGEVAADLTGDPRVRAISFTGSVDTGRRVAITAAQGLKPVSLELGGKNGALLDDIAVPEVALDAIVGAAFQCSGQRCTSISRVIVARAALQRTVDGLGERLSALVAGRGQDPATTLGPITTPAQLQRIEHLVDRAVTDGAQCLIGGERLQPASAPTGRFYAPTLLRVEDPHNVAVQEEIFGPVLGVQGFDDDDEAFALLNGTRFGLSSAIFTDRAPFASRALAEARSGMIHINHGTVPDDNMPFVGVAQSGLGIGSVGPSTLDFYTTEHSAFVAVSERGTLA